MSGEGSWLDTESVGATTRQRWRQESVQSILRMIVSRLDCPKSTAKESSPCGPLLNAVLDRS